MSPTVPGYHSLITLLSLEHSPFVGLGGLSISPCATGHPGQSWCPWGCAGAPWHSWLQHPSPFQLHPSWHRLRALQQGCPPWLPSPASHSSLTCPQAAASASGLHCWGSPIPAPCCWKGERRMSAEPHYQLNVAVCSFAKGKEKAVTFLSMKGYCPQKKACTRNCFWGLPGKPWTWECGSQRHCETPTTSWPLMQCQSLCCFPKQQTCTFRWSQIPACPSHWLWGATHRHRGAQEAVRPSLQCFLLAQKAGPPKPDTKALKETPFRLWLSMPPAITFPHSSPAVLRRLSQQMHLGCSQVGMKFAWISRHFMTLIMFSWNKWGCLQPRPNLAKSIS